MPRLWVLRLSSPPVRKHDKVRPLPSSGGLPDPITCWPTAIISCCAFSRLPLAPLTIMVCSALCGFANEVSSSAAVAACMAPLSDSSCSLSVLRSSAAAQALRMRSCAAHATSFGVCMSDRETENPCHCVMNT